jgi:hypothetical protein
LRVGRVVVPGSSAASGSSSGMGLAASGSEERKGDAKAVDGKGAAADRPDPAFWDSFKSDAKQAGIACLMARCVRLRASRVIVQCCCVPPRSSAYQPTLMLDEAGSVFTKFILDGAQPYLRCCRLASVDSDSTCAIVGLAPAP